MGYGVIFLVREDIKNIQLLFYMLIIGLYFKSSSLFTSLSQLQVPRKRILSGFEYATRMFLKSHKNWPYGGHSIPLVQL